jgi:phosphopantothenoylcysteine decarboxylase/phosphopantothenate--cysteine ligase
VWLARLLTQAGADVDVVMTRAAGEFVGAVTFEAVTGRRVRDDIFAAGDALDHKVLAKEADAMVLAPATADFLARAAHGLADDMLSACLLAMTAPVMFVPAMNDRMWANGQTARNVAHLRDSGHVVMEPDVGPLAFGEGAGPGRMPEPDVIVSHVARVLEGKGALTGRSVVVTAGATREPIDPVRFLSNHSTGRMGIAIADAAWRRGADVTLVAGHVDVTIPSQLKVVRAETTDEMASAVGDALKGADVLVMAAAPADFRPAEAATSKIRKTNGRPSPIDLVHTPDVLRETRPLRREGAVIVGFALETGDGEANARAKLLDKDLDMVVLNRADEPGAGFGSETNRVTLFDRAGRVEPLERMAKMLVAEVLLDRITELLR